MGSRAAVSEAEVAAALLQLHAPPPSTSLPARTGAAARGGQAARSRQAEEACFSSSLTVKIRWNSRLTTPTFILTPHFRERVINVRTRLAKGKLTPVLNISTRANDVTKDSVKVTKVGSWLFHNPWFVSGLFAMTV